MPLGGTVSSDASNKKVIRGDGVGTNFKPDLSDGDWVTFDVSAIANQSYEVSHVYNEDPGKLTLKTPIPADVNFSGRKIYKAGDEGNVPPGQKIEIDGTTKDYGAVDGVSSAHIFQIGSDENCQEIKLYKAPNFIYTETTPYCRITSAGTTLVYLEIEDDGTTKDKIVQASNVKLPIYKPINIENACGNEWTDTIQGIEIPGKCLVALFEHSTSAGNFPGKWSEIFTANDPDLTDNRIGKCKCFNGVMDWMCKPCASAIAIYPLK